MADELARLQKWYAAQCEGYDEVVGNEIPWQHNYGGVVLRCRRPDEPFPVRLDLFALGEHAAFLDGSALASTRPLMAPGEHVIAFKFCAAAPGATARMP